MVLMGIGTDIVGLQSGITPTLEVLKAGPEGALGSLNGWEAHSP